MRRPQSFAVVILVLGAAGLAAPRVSRCDSLLITGEPFLAASADLYTISDSGGTEDRNRVATPLDGVARNLTLLPNLQPNVGSLIRGCLRVDGVDTALCVTYTSADWPNPKGNTTTAVAASQGDLVTVHFTEQGTGSNANVRASFAVGPASSETVGAVVVTGEPFLLSSSEIFSIAQGSSGTEERNRAGVSAPGAVRNLFVVPDQQPAVGSDVHACVRVNGVDSALCVVYGSSDWLVGNGAEGNTGTSVPVAAGDAVTVHFTEQGGVVSGANYRASFEVQ